MQTARQLLISAYNILAPTGYDQQALVQSIHAMEDEQESEQAIILHILNQTKGWTRVW